MANAIINLEAAGLLVRFHVHDEIIIEVPIEAQEEATREIDRILRQPPEWAPDLPLGVEGSLLKKCYTGNPAPPSLYS